MKRPFDMVAPSQDLEDAGDGAQKRRKPGLVRIGLDEIGFWPDNRGGLGLSPYHAHEVAHDCKANKTKISRYDHVALIEIPEEKLQEIRDTNRARCDTDPLMPKYSPSMRLINN